MRYSNTALKELKKRYKNILIKCAMLNAAALLAFATPAMAEYSQPITDKPVFVFGDINLDNQDVASGQAAFGGRRMEWHGNKYQNDFPKYQMVGRSFEISNSDIYVGPVTLTVRELDTSTEKFAFNYQWNEQDKDIAKDAGVVWNDNSQTVFNKVAEQVGKSNAEYTAPTVYLFAQLNADKTAGSLSFNKTKAMIDGATISANTMSITNGSEVTFVKQEKTKLTAFYDSKIDSDGKTSLTAKTINISDSTLIVNEDAELFIKASESTTIKNTAITAKGSINFAGNVILNTTAPIQLSGGTVTFENGSTLTTTLDSTAKFAGNGEVTGTINLTNLSTGEYAFVSDSVNVGNLSFNNGLYNIEWTNDSKTDIKITEKETSEVVDEITSNTNASTQEANAVVSLISAEGTGTEKGQLIASVISEAMQSGNTSLAVDTAKKAAPTTSQMVVGIAKEAAKTMARVAGTRMDAISGRAGGDVMEGAGLWMQALYNHTKQDATSNSDGFKANSRGLAIGVDKKVSDTTTLGFGYGYMNTDADSYGRELDVDGHNFFIYGKYQPSKWYVSSVLNYNYSKYTEKKTPLGIALRSEYDVNSYGVQLMTGYDMDNGLTPEMGLRYLDVDADSYQDGMQRIRSNHDDVLTAVAGIKYTTDVKTKDVIFKPTARLSATYDVISDNSRANVSVIGGNNYAIDGKRLHRFGVEAGAGVTASVDNIDITLEYTGAFRQDYKSQGGMLKARYNF